MIKYRDLIMVIFDFHVINSPESAVCHVTGINNENRLRVLEIQKVQGYTIIFRMVCKYLLKLDLLCLFNKQTVDKYDFQDHRESVYRCTVDIFLE